MMRARPGRAHDRATQTGSRGRALPPRRLCRALALVALALPIGALAQEDPAALARDAIDQLATATAIHAAAQSKRDRVGALTETIRAYEQGLAALRAGLREVTVRERALTVAFEARSGDVSQLLGVLATLEVAPAPLLLLHPSGPLGTARSGMMLSEVTPALAAQAARLKADLDELSHVRALQTEAEAMLARALRGAQSARTELSQAIADRAPLPRAFTDDPARMAELARSADTLSAFTAALASLGAPPPTNLGTIPQGVLPLPVAGRLLRRAGEADAAGTVRPGILLATRPRALVTAPVAATIRYVGPLLDYGNVMILEPKADTLMVLGGLAEVYGAPGAIVAPGEPLGLMGGLAIGLQDARALGAGLGRERRGLETTGTEPTGGRPSGAGAELSETLYIEIRQGDSPVDPTAWFAIDRQQ